MVRGLVPPVGAVEESASAQWMTAHDDLSSAFSELLETRAEAAGFDINSPAGLKLHKARLRFITATADYVAAHKRFVDAYSPVVRISNG